MAYGTLQIKDLLAANGQTVYQYGEDNAFQAIANELQQHNNLFAAMVGDFGLVTTTDRVRRYGANAAMKVEDLDEHGVGDAQKVTAGIDIGFPLRRKGLTVQWTLDYFRRVSTPEFAAQFTAAQNADLRGIETEVKRAIFTPTSNTTYKDRLVDNVTLPVRAFLNADSLSIPSAPDGTTFDGSTHTHYKGYASSAVAAADIKNLISNVTEHGVDGEVRLLINQAQEATIRGFSASGEFTPFTDTRIVQGSGVTYAQGALDMININNRAIGVFGAAVVYVKPWVPANYYVALDSGDSNNAPLIMRQPLDAEFGQFRLVSDDENHPLRANMLAREYGIAPWQRQKVAVLYGGASTYSAPSI